jgi:hypothetical protein
MSIPSFDEDLINALESLAARPVTNRKQLAAWQLAADRLERSFTPEQADALPSFVWHYLADADIRLRNAAYRAEQEQQLGRLLVELGSSSHKPVPRRRRQLV